MSKRRKYFHLLERKKSANIYNVQDFLDEQIDSTTPVDVSEIPVILQDDGDRQVSISNTFLRVSATHVLSDTCLTLSTGSTCSYFLAFIFCNS